MPRARKPAGLGSGPSGRDWRAVPPSGDAGGRLHFSPALTAAISVQAVLGPQPDCAGLTQEAFPLLQNLSLGASILRLIQPDFSDKHKAPGLPPTPPWSSPLVPVPEGPPFGSALSPACPPGHCAPPPGCAVSVTCPGDSDRSLGPCVCCASLPGGSLHPETDKPSGAISCSVAGLKTGF